MKTLHKQFPAQIKEFNDKELTITHFISTETQDSDGDIMRVDGMRTRGQVVVLKQHGQDETQGMEPIARPISIGVGTNENGVKGILVTTKYYDGSHLTPPDNTGRRLFEKCRDKFMPNWSVGFSVVKSTPVTGGGQEITEWLMHEYSQVAVGANEEATFKSLTDDAKACDKHIPVFGFTEEPKKEKAVLLPGTIEKSIGSRLATSEPYASYNCLMSALDSEIYNLVWSGNASDFDPTEQVTALIDEFKEYAVPRIIDYIKALISQRYGTVEQKALAETQQKDFQAKGGMGSGNHGHTGRAGGGSVDKPTTEIARFIGGLQQTLTQTVEQVVNNAFEAYAVPKKKELTPATAKDENELDISIEDSTGSEQDTDDIGLTIEDNDNSPDAEEIKKALLEKTNKTLVANGDEIDLEIET